MDGSDEPVEPPPDARDPGVSTAADGEDCRVATDGGRDERADGADGDADTDANVDADDTDEGDARTDDGGFVFGGARDRPDETSESLNSDSGDPDEPGSDPDGFDAGPASEPNTDPGPEPAADPTAESEPARDGDSTASPTAERGTAGSDGVDNDDGNGDDADSRATDADRVGDRQAPTAGAGDGQQADDPDDPAAGSPSGPAVTGGDEERPRTNAAGDPAESAPDTTGRGADAEAGTGTGTAGERETDADPNADTRSTERAAATDSTERPEATRTATTAASPTGTAPGGPDPTADEGRSGEGLRGVPVLGGLLATGDDYPVAWSLVVAVGLALVALVVGFTLVLGSLLGLGAAGIAASPTVQIVASLLLFQGVTMGGVAAVYLSVRGLDADYVGLSLEKVFGDPVRDVLAAVVGFVVALGVAFGGAAIVSTFGVQAGTNQAADLAFEDPEVLLFLIPGAFLLIGPGEELLFRGVIQSRLRETIGRWPAVVVGAALFAAVHVTALSGGASARLVSITILFFPSLVFGAVYEFTDNLAVPALVHGAYNALIFTVLYLAIRFADLSADAVQSGLVRPP